MVNINKLKGKIVEKGMSVRHLADEMGIDQSTLYRKMSSNGEQFTIRDAHLICKILKLSGDEATAIFFSQYVA